MPGIAREGEQHRFVSPDAVSSPQEGLGEGAVDVGLGDARRRVQRGEQKRHWRRPELRAVRVEVAVPAQPDEGAIVDTLHDAVNSRCVLRCSREPDPFHCRGIDRSDPRPGLEALLDVQLGATLRV